MTYSTPTDLRSHRRDLGFTKRTLAKVIGVGGKRTVRWEKGARKIPRWVPVMLDLLKNEADQSEADDRRLEAEKRCLDHLRLAGEVLALARGSGNAWDDGRPTSGS